jgi:hypothetical protein
MDECWLCRLQIGEAKGTLIDLAPTCQIPEPEMPTRRASNSLLTKRAVWDRPLVYLAFTANGETSRFCLFQASSIRPKNAGESHSPTHLFEKRKGFGLIARAFTKKRYFSIPRYSHTLFDFPMIL